MDYSLVTFSNTEKGEAMATYYTLTATIDGELEVIFGSFVKADCEYELDAEKESLKDQGYKGFKIVAAESNETPDLKVYAGEVVDAHKLFMDQAPSFNFEKSEEELLEHALDVGFVTPLEGSDDLYLINKDY